MTAQDRIDQVAARQNSPNAQLLAQLENPKLLDFIRSVAPGQDPRGIVNVAFAHYQATPALQKCTTQSIVRGVAEAAKLSLTVDGVLGHAYLVPYGREAKMQIGYRGWIHLGYRSDRVLRIHADTICENDSFRHVEGTSPILEHEKPLSNRGEIVGSYAVAHLVGDGPPLVVVLGLDEIEASRSRSASAKSGKSPWVTDFPAMAKVCPLRRMGKLLPVPILQAAATRDEAREDGRDPGPSVIDVDPIAVEDDERVPAPEAVCHKCQRILSAGEKCPDCEMGVVA